MSDITAKTVSVWHLGRAWAGSQGEGIPQTDGSRTLSRALARCSRPLPAGHFEHLHVLTLVGRVGLEPTTGGL
jgi:hypothetical protein